jgi:hypothetical protein
MGCNGNHNVLGKAVYVSDRSTKNTRRSDVARLTEAASICAIVAAIETLRAFT